MDDETLEQFQRLYKALQTASTGLQHLHIQCQGEAFYSLHELLEETYGLTRDLLDEVGERIGLAGGELPATPAQANVVPVGLVFDEAGQDPSVAEAAETASEAIGRLAEIAQDAIEAAEELPVEEDVAIEVKREVTTQQYLFDQIK